jgi:predicted tellurium resistance membrane protein TerC
MAWILTFEGWIAFFTLLVLEIVLGIDNIIFLAILSSKLPIALRQRARVIGLSLAILMRLALLFSISWLVHLTAPLFVAFDRQFSGRDLVLIAGGLFLIAKTTREIHERLEGTATESSTHTQAGPSFHGVVVQIVLLDAVFSLDSVITAVGLVDDLKIMVAAVVAAVAFMIVFASLVSDFVERHPSVKMLALSFLLLIGVSLIVEGFDVHVPRGYVYFAMMFAAFVEFLNLRTTKKKTPLPLH